MHTKLLKEHLMSLSLYVCMKVQEKNIYIYIFFYLTIPQRQTQAN